MRLPRKYCQSRNLERLTAELAGETIEAIFYRSARGPSAGALCLEEYSMRILNIGLALSALLAGLNTVSCGESDDDSDPATGGNGATGGKAAPGTGGTAPSGGRPTNDAGAGGQVGPAQGGQGGAGEAGSPPAPQAGSNEGGAGGAAPCNSIEDLLPPTETDNPGPACQAYADCMSEGCGEQYEPAFGPEWESGDLSGGACGPAVPCFQDCGCDQACATECLVQTPTCAPFAFQFQLCYGVCTADAEACREERSP
jgi:hypothetical protein